MPIGQSNAETTAATPSRWFVWLWILPWLDLIRQLSHTWSLREQYSYGWFVPLLAVYMGWRRSGSQPAPSSPRQSASWVWVVVGFACALALLRPVVEINADWPLVVWGHALLVLGVSLVGVYLAGGTAWLRHYWFPLAFMLVAVAWPHRLEKGLTTTLMHTVARSTVEILGILGIPGIQKGNLIELGVGTVGVDEACSGIRSFQSTIMAAIVLGEITDLKPKFRLALLTLGLTVSFLLNIVRTLLLSLVASRDGIQAVDRWHDGAGLSLLVASSIVLWGISRVMAMRGGVHPAAKAADTPGHFIGARFKPYTYAVCIVTASAWILTEAWYRGHESRANDGFEWRASFPKTLADYKDIQLSKRISDMIGHDLGISGTWTDTNGGAWIGYFFRWEPTSIQNVMRARVHRPDICLPAAGLRQVGASGEIEITAHGIGIPFRTYTYTGEGKTYYVYFCRWESTRGASNELQANSGMDRVQSVLKGRRRLGQQTLEFILGGYDSSASADAALQASLPKLLQPEPVSQGGRLPEGPVNSVAFIEFGSTLPRVR